MAIAVLGAGAWGTAIACHLARRHPVLLWAREPGQVAAMAADRSNERYLESVTFPPAVTITGRLADAVAAADRNSLIVVATPMVGLRESLQLLASWSGGGTLPPVIAVSKGLEEQTGLLAHEVAQAAAPGLAFGVLSGPSFALEVARGLPCALVAASGHEAVSERVQALFHHGAMRIYRSPDRVGVELAGAVKNIIALAAGISDGLALGNNARAALVTRGLAETARLGVALGALPTTFMGLAGIGDMMLTCTGELSRNRQVGLALAQGSPLARITAGLGHVAEGVRCCPAVLARADSVGVDMPIARAVQAVLAGTLSARDAVSDLLARDPAAEGL